MSSSELFTATPGNRGLTELGTAEWLKHYEAIRLTEGKTPEAYFSAPAVACYSALASGLRRKNWKTSSPYFDLSDAVGLKGELALWRFMGIPANTAMDLFMEGVEAGDSGYDLQIGRWKIDQKTTTNRDGIFQLSEKAATQSSAHLFTFGEMEYRNGAAYTKLTGWSWKADVRQHQVESKGRHRIRVGTLRRAGVFHPFHLLKTLSTEEF